ncbi:uncharacterized protein LOC130558717 [Triplophysa rosa]|uniref:DUF4585 domain-containing protein n=1 Tax=Triplophysa rosa TaxID=992332 RepID=A0A9W7WPF0_TRIRA|nr:uncharacterized protein LOC130558717 [Triplophysa rosa]XP_057197292.1 uncharacterized protein LOC130558717 [Triplophysa rosa]KAI7805907.1 hypothetical protein IRJ41_020966 [Triplophysa rosa]
MSSLEKLHTVRGSMQGHRKFSDGFSDTSSSGSFMDETDREVSNLTDRAFRSLCIGEEAIYNDNEFSSSPTERHKAFAEEQQQKTVVQMSSQVECSYGVLQHAEVGEQSEMASTFQHSYGDVTHQEQVFKAGSLTYMNNGSKELTWQQSRSASRVSSLIKAFSSGECYQDSGTCDVILARDKSKDLGHESWDKSALLSIQKELSEFSSGYHQNFKSGPFQTYRNHFYTSDVASAVAQMDTKVLMKSSKSKFKALNSTNCFFHSEFSPFQLWEEYNRFPFESTNASGFISAIEFPRWYDSPMYKELKDTHRVPNNENRHFNQSQTQDVAHSQRSRSTVIQKAFAIEKRCESEMASNCPPWKKGINFVKSKFPGNRPSTVSPTYEKTCRPDSSLFGNSKVLYDIQQKVEKVVDSAQPSSVTPFNITQLLRPVIHTRQETETSEILQFAHTPSISDYSSQGETDPKPLADAKHLRDSYKSRASSLLFNIKDNRKRVKITYSPTKFKGLEVTDRNKQPSNLEGRESRFSDILACQETSQENFIEMDTWASGNPKVPSVAPITPKNGVDALVPYDNLTITSPQIQDGAVKFFHGSSQGHFLSTDLLTNTESTQRELSSHNLSTQDKSSLTSEGQFKDLNITVSPTRPEIANVLPKTHPHSLPTQTSAQQRQGPSNNASQNDPKHRQDFAKKTHFEYSQNETVKERSQWEQTGSVNSIDGETLTHDGKFETRPFRGEIAALIEMDKHRKAIAKQYLPATNNGYSVRKETYMQKVNEDIKLGRLVKEEEKEVTEGTMSFRKTSYSDTAVHNNPLNTSRDIDSYGVPQNNHLNKRLSPPKEERVNSGSQNYTVKNDLSNEIQHSERAAEQCTSSNSMPTQKTSLYGPSEEKGQNNGELLSYQQYRYGANKQWLMTSANRHIKDNVCTSQILEQNGTKSYKIPSTVSNTQQSTQNTTTVSQNTDGASNLALRETDSVKHSKQNNPCVLSSREERFSINDILTIRDIEQARRMRENTSAGDLARSENPQNQIKRDTAEEKLTRTEVIKEKEAQSYIVSDHAAPGYPRKDVHNLHEGPANINTERKDKLMSKNSDRVTTRALSYKERIQSKQEILTSRLKAHAQKEITAIKEKELARQALLARNKPSKTVNNETAQDGQEVHFAKKESTADKLNHLFQDITYSSVTQHKELNKTHNDHTVNGSIPSRQQQTKESNFQEDIQTTALDTKSECKKQDCAAERKYDKPPSDDREITKEAFSQNVQLGGRTTVKNIQNNQPARISDNKQLSKKSPEEINRKEQLVIHSPYVHTSPIETKSNNTSHKPPALHCEKQTMQYDHTGKEFPKYHHIGNAGESSPTQYNYSGKAMSTSNNINNAKMDDKSPLTTENQKANGLNKTSDVQRGYLDRNAPNAEEATVRHKSGITAAVERSKNELIQNSSGIKVSQLKSSSNDMKFKNGNPPANLLSVSADSKRQASTINADDEQIKHGNHRYSSGLNPPTSSTENTVRANEQFSPRNTKMETLEYLVKDAEVAISKHNTTSKNDVKQNKSSPVKAVETTPPNKMLESQQESGTSSESALQTVSHNANECCQQTDENKKTLLSVNKTKTHQLKEFNKVSISDKRLAESASHTEIEEDFARQIGTSSKEENERVNERVKVSQKVISENTKSPSDSTPQKQAKDSTEENVSTQRTNTRGEIKTQKNNIHPVSKQNADSTKDESNVLTPSKEEPTEEPMIFSICVSSKTETDSDEEPMIYTICVSSKSHMDEQQDPVKHEDERCVIRAEEDKSVKNDRAESVHDENESIGHREPEVSSNIEPEKEHMVRNCERPVTKDKQEHGKPSEIGSIGSSYEDLLAKYGLPVRNHGHASKHHTEDKREIKEKESDVSPTENLIKHEINRSPLSQEKSLGNTQVQPEESRSASVDQQTQLLKENDIKIKQQANSSVKDQHYDIPSITQSKRTEKQQIAGNDKPKLSPSPRDATLKPKDSANAKHYQDTENIEASEQSRTNGDVQLRDKQVEEQVRNTEKVKRLRKTENITDNVCYFRKSPLKTEDVSLTAKQPAVTTDSTNRAKTDEVLKTPVSKASVTKHILNTKANETTGTEQTISHTNEKSQQLDSEDKRSDRLLPQNTTLKYGAKQDDCAAFVQKQSVSAKDAQILKNSVKGDVVEKNAQPDQGKAGFTTHNESTNRMKMVSKDGAATHVNNYLGKVNSVGEDVCSVVKHKHGSFEVPKFHSKDIKVSTEEKSSKQDVMVDHKTQHEVTQKECLRGTAGTENMADKDKQTNSPVKSPQNKPETMDDLKATGEKMPKQKDYTEKEITPPKKERPEGVPPSLRQETVQKQASDKRKEDSGMSGPSGHLYNKDGYLKVSENKSNITGKKDGNDENLEIQQADRTTSNQQSDRKFLKQIEVEEKGFASQQGIKREVTSSKPEVPQRAKKVNRPEISAIADYARLKVISAEDDTKEIDFLPKINIYHSQGQTVTGLHKNSHGNESLLVEESKREKAQNPKPKPLQFLERDKETSTQHHFNPSLSTAQTCTTPTASDSEIGASGLGGTRERVSTSHKESNTKPVFAEQTNKEVHHNLYQSKNLQDANILPLQTEDGSRQAHGKATQKENSQRQKSLANLPLKDVSAAVKPEENLINMTSPAVGETEELQYYTVNALDSDTKPKQTPQPPSPSHAITPNKVLSYKLQEEEKEESSLLQSLTDYGKVNMTGQQSNSSSPAMGKPTMFRVKDNTIRTSSVTKAVKPRFHRSFSDDFRMGSPREHLSGSEKGDEEHIEHKEPANPPVLHEPAAASHRLYKMRETQNNSPSVEHTAKQSKSHQRRSQNLDDEDTRSVISVMLEDAENCTADAADISAACIPKIDSYRDTYQRPASVSYERPESSCYERPESACSDMRPLGKPPTVPPKTEKALRRAQRLTTRRMKKAENKMTPETDQIRNVSSVPSSPSDVQSMHPATQTTPALSRYSTEPNYTTPTHSVVAQPFTMTQRKLLQDPNSGQYFMVDMPLPVKTKTFYDPETGKYVQLNVRQRSQSAHSQPTPVEVLNGPYVLYPGFLPVAASSLPSVRSSSQLSAPASLTNDRGPDQWKQQRDPESAYRSSEQVRGPSRNVQNRNSVRHTDIITMSELEDFAMEST